VVRVSVEAAPLCLSLSRSVVADLTYEFIWLAGQGRGKDVKAPLDGHPLAHTMSLRSRIRPPTYTYIDRQTGSQKDRQIERRERERARGQSQTDIRETHTEGRIEKPASQPAINQSYEGRAVSPDISTEGTE